MESGRLVELSGTGGSPGLGTGYDGQFTITAVTALTFSFNAGVPDLPSPAGGGGIANTGAVEQGNQVHISTQNPHTFSPGQQVTITGMGGFNGTFQITSVINAFSFTYNLIAAGLTATGGGTATGGANGTDGSGASSRTRSCGTAAVSPTATRVSAAWSAAGGHG